MPRKWTGSGLPQTAERMGNMVMKKQEWKGKILEKKDTAGKKRTGRNMKKLFKRMGKNGNGGERRTRKERIQLHKNRTKGNSTEQKQNGKKKE